MNTMRPMKTKLTELHAGRCGFAEFVEATRTEWQALARYIMRRWSCPEAVELIDIEQELLVGAWHAVQTWREDGASLHQHVIYSSVSAAKNWVHTQRNAKRRHGNMPGRYPLTFTKLGAEPDMVVEAVQETAVYHREIVGLLMAGATRRERLCIAALLSQGSLVNAATAIYADVNARRMLQLNSERDARRAMRQALNQLESR